MKHAAKPKMQHLALNEGMINKDKRANEVAKQVLKLSAAVLDRYPRNENTRDNKTRKADPREKQTPGNAPVEPTTGNN